MLGNPAPDFLAGSSEMGALIRAADWTRTPLGPPESWPISLRTAVGIMLSSRYAMFVWWGRRADQSLLRCVSAVPRRKAPDALGRPATKVWAEIWDLIGPRTEAALEPAESTFDEALLLIMERCGYPEETYFTFSYSPLRNMQETSAASLLPLPDETFAHHSRTPAQAFARGCRRLVGSAYARTGRRCGGRCIGRNPGECRSRCFI